MREFALGDLTEVGRAITYGVVQPGHDPEDGVLLVRAGDLADGRVLMGSLRTITHEVSRSFARTVLKGGELLVSLVGTPGEVAIAPAALSGANLSRQVAMVALNRSVDARYIKYYLTSDVGRAHLFSRTGGAVQQVINLADLKTVPIAVPDLIRQRRVADCLSDFDDLIDNNRRRIELLEDSVRLLFEEWFLRQRGPVGLLPRGADGLPSGWTIQALGKLTTKIGSGATPRGGDASYVTTGIALIRSQNIYDYSFVDDGLAYIDEEQASRLSNVAVEPQDVLLNITGASVARCCMVPEVILPARVNQHVMILRASAEKLDPYYLLFALNAQVTKRLLLSYAQKGSTREALTKDQMASFEIMVPDEKSMRDFGSFARDAIQQRELLASQNIALRNARDLLLPRLMSGQLTV